MTNPHEIIDAEMRALAAEFDRLRGHRVEVEGVALGGEIPRDQPPTKRLRAAKPKLIVRGWCHECAAFHVSTKHVPRCAACGQHHPASMKCGELPSDAEREAWYAQPVPHTREEADERSQLGLRLRF